MQAIYNLNTSELDINFLNSIKEMFKHKNIDIIISDGLDNEFDSRVSELQKRFEDYKKKPDLYTAITSDFWRDNEKRLIQRHKQKVT
jgi:hypothetical protein